MKHAIRHIHFVEAMKAPAGVGRRVAVPAAAAQMGHGGLTA
jgi:hypothetical protein